MTFQFESMADFLFMSGHGPYVWAAYLITAGALIFLLVNPVLQRKAFMRDQHKRRTLGRANQAERDQPHE